MGAVHHWKEWDDRSMEGTRSLDWHLHKLSIPIVWANPLQRTSMRNAPSQPHTGTTVPPLSDTSNTKSISQEQHTKLVSHSEPNNIVLLPLPGNGLQAAADVWRQ